jgi:hypothetical protein
MNLDFGSLFEARLGIRGLSKRPDKVWQFSKDSSVDIGQDSVFFSQENDVTKEY